MAPETIRPDPIAPIRQRVEVCRRENYPYDSLETAYRDRLDLLVCVETEQTMHAAWRKRAEEAEAEVGRLRQQLMELPMRIVQRVAELPDRSSPDDWPDAMLVTVEELRNLVSDEITALLSPGGDQEPT